jgi:hypothetical protein
MVITKEVEGEVDSNDGEFAEINTIGIEGIEDGLWLGTMQIRRVNMEDTWEEFLHRLPVRLLLGQIDSTSRSSHMVSCDSSSRTGATQCHHSPRTRTMASSDYLGSKTTKRPEWLTYTR